MVVLILWIYYLGIILYFGAEFTKAWTLAHGTAIYPVKISYTINQPNK